MAGYGEVTPAAAAVLDARVGRLVELLDALGGEVADQRPASS
jgi:hypothetical protein